MKIYCNISFFFLRFGNLKLYTMDEVIEDIDRVTDLLSLLKARYFVLRTLYDIGKV